jgi:hypothetical protein
MIHNVYYPIREGGEVRKGQRFVKCSLGYELGGYSFLTGEKSRRGYYVYIRTVTCDGNLESFALGEGVKQCLVACGRKSPKKEAEARKLFDEQHQGLARLFYGASSIADKIDWGHPER